jgi:hypothetical protein
MPTVPQLSDRTSKLPKARGELVSSTIGSAAAPGFRLRPLQVTWEMMRVCEWKNASRRSTKSAPREVNHLSTAEAFHLIEEVAAMHVPLLALTGGDPVTRPDLFPIIEFAVESLGAHITYSASHAQSRGECHPRIESMRADAGGILATRRDTGSSTTTIGESTGCTGGRSTSTELVTKCSYRCR